MYSVNSVDKTRRNIRETKRLEEEQISYLVCTNCTLCMFDYYGNVVYRTLYLAKHHSNENKT